MFLTDSHSHVYGEEFNEDRLQVIKRAKENEVLKCFLPVTEYASIEPMLKTYSLDKDFFVPMVGLYPGSVKENVKEELSKIKPYLNDKRIKGIGEIGLDFYWNKDFYEQQIYAFREQMLWSKEYHDLPVSIHARKAVAETIKVLKELNYSYYKGVFHCFSGDLNEARKVVDMGFFLGMGGVVTFKNSHLAEIVKQIGLDYLVLETDAPYLTPVPFRGQRNEPMHIKIIAEKLSDILSLPIEKIAEQTTLNALKLIKN